VQWMPRPFAFRLQVSVFCCYLQSRMAKVIEACVREGHDIVSLLVARGIEPTTKQPIEKYQVLCRKCGNDLPFILKNSNYRVIQRRTKKEMEKTDDGTST
jgi:hypothetical protein